MKIFKLILKGIGWLLLALLLLGVLAGLCLDIYYDVRVMNSTPQNEKAICLSDWYRIDNLKNLPVRCLKYYQ